MSRPRIPTAILKARGAFVKDPKRARARAGEPKGLKPLGPPPRGLVNKPGCAALDAWREIAAMLPPGVAKQSDRVAVEIAARLLAELRSEGGMAAGRLSALQRALAALGMSPADRSKVSILGGGEDEPSPWDKLIPSGSA